MNGLSVKIHNIDSFTAAGGTDDQESDVWVCLCVSVHKVNFSIYTAF